MADEDVEFRIKKIKIRLQKEKPFFADILFFMSVKPMPEGAMHDTMAVDMNGNLYYSDAFVNKLSDDELKGVLIHECLHMALLHISRGQNKCVNINGPAKHFYWNLAVDCQANYIAVQNGFVLPTKDVACLPRNADVVVTVQVGGKRYSHTVKEVEKKTAEEIYVELYNHLKIPITTVNISVPGGSQQDKALGEGSGGFDNHIYDGTKEDAERSEKDWKQRAINAVYRAKNIGNLPAGIERLVDGLIEPKIDWRTKLYKFISDDVISDYTYARPHKRSEAVGFYNPSFTKEGLNVAVFIDTSGSIGDEELTEFKAECIGIVQSFGNVQMLLGYCDADVHSVEEISGETDIIYSKPKGGGGTDMRQCFTWLKKNGHRPDVVVILTDGYTPFPESQAMKTLWVISENGISPEQFNENIGEWVKM